MPPSSSRPAHVLPVIVLAQFAGTSLWFAGNAVLSDLQREWALGSDAIGLVTSSVQLGFITGTLVFAVLNVADRFPPRLVFLASSLLGAGANALIAVGVEGVVALLVLRFAVGFFLAGIYPVGMKIAASWYAEGLGHALGLLVGALVLGTAFPHLLRAVGQGVLGSALEWREVVLGVSAMATLGGVLLYALVPSGPHLPNRSPFDPRALARIFRVANFRASAFGYFGHMWELYALWTVVPLLLGVLGARHPELEIDVSLWSFVVIAVGAFGCAGGGWVSQHFGSARVAAAQITVSGALCVLSPLLFFIEPRLALGLMVLWGVVVVGDSPQFSALNATTAPRELVGTALTIVTSIGFLITIPSIQLLTWLVDTTGPDYALLALAPGPLLGLLALRRLLGASVQPTA